MLSKDFKSNLLRSMGSGVKCITSTDQNRRLSTYYNKQEVCTQKHVNGPLNLDQFLPTLHASIKTKQNSTSRLNETGTGEARPTVAAALRTKMINKKPLNFDKLPKRKNFADLLSGSATKLPKTNPGGTTARSDASEDQIQIIMNSLKQSEYTQLEPADDSTSLFSPAVKETGKGIASNTTALPGVKIEL